MGTTYNVVAWLLAVYLLTLWEMAVRIPLVQFDTSQALLVTGPLLVPGYDLHLPTLLFRRSLPHFFLLSWVTRISSGQTSLLFLLLYPVSFLFLLPSSPYPTFPSPLPSPHFLQVFLLLGLGSFCLVG